MPADTSIQHWMFASTGICLFPPYGADHYKLGFTTMARYETSMSLPSRWADDPLSEFLNKAFKNILATFVHKQQGVDLLLQVDQSFVRIGENLKSPPDILAALFFVRSHSAFRASCRLSMSGQIAETFPCLRACLEYALYAIHINVMPIFGDIWIRRHDDDAARRAVRNEFQHVTVVETLRARDSGLCSSIEQLYEHTLDFGAHPNERAITESTEIAREGGGVGIKQLYLHGDSLSLDQTIKSTAQVGLGSLCIFRYIFPEPFNILDIQQSIDFLRQRLQ